MLFNSYNMCCCCFIHSFKYWRLSRDSLLCAYMMDFNNRSFVRCFVHTFDYNLMCQWAKLLLCKQYVVPAMPALCLPCHSACFKTSRLCNCCTLWQVSVDVYIVDMPYVSLYCCMFMSRFVFFFFPFL